MNLFLCYLIRSFTPCYTRYILVVQRIVTSLLELFVVYSINAYPALLGFHSHGVCYLSEIVRSMLPFAHSSRKFSAHKFVSYKSLGILEHLGSNILQSKYRTVAKEPWIYNNLYVYIKFFYTLSFQDWVIITWFMIYKRSARCHSYLAVEAWESS